MGKSFLRDNFNPYLTKLITLDRVFQIRKPILKVGLSFPGNSRKSLPEIFSGSLRKEKKIVQHPYNTITVYPEENLQFKKDKAPGNGIC